MLTAAEIQSLDNERRQARAKRKRINTERYHRRFWRIRTERINTQVDRLVRIGRRTFARHNVVQTPAPTFKPFSLADFFEVFMPSKRPLPKKPQPRVLVKKRARNWLGEIYEYWVDPLRFADAKRNKYKHPHQGVRECQRRMTPRTMAL